MNGYFDHNATTPVFRESRDALIEALETRWHNPSGLYPKAAATKRALETARSNLAQHLGIEEPGRIVFTSGATEANNIVFRHIAAKHPECRALVSEIEHPSVLRPAAREIGQGLETIPISSGGSVQLEALRSQLESGPAALVSIMAANNETGVLQPWLEAAELCREFDTPFHCDATQWIGKYPSAKLGQCDWLSGSAHKFGGPKGTGFLVVPQGTDALSGAPVGGSQERSLRAGTESYPDIAAMLAALEHAQLHCEQAAEIARHRDAFEKRLAKAIPGARPCGTEAARLWNTSMLVLPEHKNLKWLTRLADLGFELSTGSACSSGKGNPSPAMIAMGLDFEEMGRVLRISAGWETRESDWQALLEAFVATHRALGSASKRKSISLSGLNPLSP